LYLIVNLTLSLNAEAYEKLTSEPWRFGVSFHMYEKII